MQSGKNTMIVYPCGRLEGEITIQGAKNSVLPIMAAAVANKGVTVIENCPQIADVYTMAALLRECGCMAVFENHMMIIDAKDAGGGCFFSEDSKKMRASILLMGGCLGRFHEFSMAAPGGCAIGKRPVNLHVAAMNAMGAEVTNDERGVSGKAGGEGLKGCRIQYPVSSVGATQNALIAAALAEGATELVGASREPEIWDLCEYLKLLGCRIQGERTGHIRIFPMPKAVKRDGKDVRYVLPGDRIVAGTLLAAAAGATGNICIKNIPVNRIESIVRLLGAGKIPGGEGVVLNADRRPVLETVISTGPFPEFPTDMQSVFLTLMAVSGNFSIMEETVFDTRFRAAEELNRLGADIRTEGQCAYVYGRRKLHGGTVTATDLRGGAALVIAGLVADGPVTVKECGHIHRGYEDLAGDLKRLGAVILEE